MKLQSTEKTQSALQVKKSSGRDRINDLKGHTPSPPTCKGQSQEHPGLPALCLQISDIKISAVEIALVALLVLSAEVLATGGTSLGHSQETA